jgi:DNA invertase Pin-like site-specific DNA recombinase
MNNRLKIAFYIRAVSGNLSEMRRQRRTMEKEFCRRGFEFDKCEINIYRDAQEAGRTFGPELLRLIEDVKARRVDIIFVARLNRIAVTAQGLSEFYKLIGAHKFRFISERENMDSVSWPWAQEVANANL